MHTYHGYEVCLIPGDVIVITPHEEHSYKIDAKTVIYNCLFYPEAMKEDWHRLQEVKNIFDFLIVEPFYRMESCRQEILHLEPSVAASVEALLKKMLEEQEKKQPDFVLVQKSYLILLLCLLGRAWDKQFNESKTLYLGKRDLLAEAIHFIESNTTSELRVEDIAAKVYLSPNYFRKVFKEATGLTPIDYINRIRVSKACELLRDEYISISRVAEMVGINDLNYFSRLFRSLAGCSPSEFRKKSKLY
jgi:AraC family L-rhamnose operon regulatory protein RhaS